MLPLLLLCIIAGASAAPVQCCSGFSSNPIPINAGDCYPSSYNAWAMVTCYPVESCMAIKCSFNARPSDPATYSQFCTTQDKLNQTIRLNAASGVTCTVSAASRTGISLMFALTASLVAFIAM